MSSQATNGVGYQLAALETVLSREKWAAIVVGVVCQWSRAQLLRLRSTDLWRTTDQFWIADRTVPAAVWRVARSVAREGQPLFGAAKLRKDEVRWWFPRAGKAVGLIGLAFTHLSRLPLEERVSFLREAHLEGAPNARHHGPTGAD